MGQNTKVNEKEIIIKNSIQLLLFTVLYTSQKKSYSIPRTWMYGGFYFKYKLRNRKILD